MATTSAAKPKAIWMYRRRRFGSRAKAETTAAAMGAASSGSLPWGTPCGLERTLRNHRSMTRYGPAGPGLSLGLWPGRGTHSGLLVGGAVEWIGGAAACRDCVHCQKH